MDKEDSVSAKCDEHNVKERVIVFYKNPEDEDLVRNRMVAILMILEDAVETEEQDHYITRAADAMELALMYYDKQYPDAEE